MKKELFAYYISRLLFSVIFALLFYRSGWSLWVCVIFGLLIYCLFIWYAYSGHFLIDPNHPLTPLRRDARGEIVRDRSLLSAVVVGSLSYVLLNILSLFINIPGQLLKLVLPVMVIIYFIMSTVLFRRGIQ